MVSSNSICISIMCVMHARGAAAIFLAVHMPPPPALGTAATMAALWRAGITHIIDMQIEFDDTMLAAPHGIEVLWNPIDDDFQPKPPGIFERGVEFATQALSQDDTKLFIHCAAGVHRAPMMTLAVLGSMGWTPDAAQDLIEKERPVVDFADVYVRSVERFLDQQVKAEK